MDLRNAYYDSTRNKMCNKISVSDYKIKFKIKTNDKN